MPANVSDDSPGPRLVRTAFDAKAPVPLEVIFNCAPLARILDPYLPIADDMDDRHLRVETILRDFLEEREDSESKHPQKRRVGKNEEFSPAEYAISLVRLLLYGPVGKGDEDYRTLEQRRKAAVTFVGQVETDSRRLARLGTSTTWSPFVRELTAYLARQYGDAHFNERIPSIQRPTTVTVILNKESNEDLDVTELQTDETGVNVAPVSVLVGSKAPSPVKVTQAVWDEIEMVLKEPDIVEKLAARIDITHQIQQQDQRDSREPQNRAVPARPFDFYLIQPKPRSETVDRTILIRELTKRRWIDGGLRAAESANHDMILEVALGLQRGLVDDPAINPRLVDIRDNQPLDEGKRLIDVFNQGVTGRRLLVVGDFGSGKSTHLLQLAEALLEQPSEPQAVQTAPAVLLLSSWRTRNASFRSWLDQEMSDWYHLGPDAVEDLLIAGKIQLLLDGLDEIPESNRIDKIESLNSFLADERYVSTPVVITSREQEYGDLGLRLKLHEGVRVRPLAIREVLAVFEHHGSEFDQLREALRVDLNLQRTLDTPLMVMVSLFAYSGQGPIPDVPKGSIEEIRHQIFSSYERRMLERERPLIEIEAGSRAYKERPFSARETHRYLVYLARLMDRRHARVLFADELTPEWLPELGEEDLLPRNDAGPFAALVRKVGLDHASTGAVGVGLGIVLGLFFIGPAALFVWGIPIGATIAVGLSLILGFAIFSLFGLARMRPFGISLAFVLDDDEHVPRAATRWIWVATRALRWSPLVTVMGAGCFLVALTGRDWISAATLAGTFVVGSLIGTGMAPDYERLPSKPGEALSVSGRWLGALLGATIILGLVVTACIWLTGGPWLAALSAVPLSASLLMITGPGRAWLRSTALRFGGSISGLLPRERTTFLAHANERALLRQQGGGYAFLHASLHDYFAAADPEQQ